ncbi:MAG: DsrE family protein [Lacisediminihabitans sp.]
MPQPHLLIHAYGVSPPDTLASALRVAQNAAKDLGHDVVIHIVVQGPTVALLTASTSFLDELNDATSSPTIQIVACRNSMTSAGVAEGDLLPGVGSVPSAVGYLARKQWEGWAYVRL